MVLPLKKIVMRRQGMGGPTWISLALTRGSEVLKLEVVKGSHLSIGCLLSKPSGVPCGDCIGQRHHRGLPEQAGGGGHVKQSSSGTVSSNSDVGRKS